MLNCRRFLIGFAITALSCIVIIMPAWGQGFTASVLGRVTDNSGAVVPQTTVTAEHIETGQKTISRADEAGHYTLPKLAPGNYRITAELPGFKRIVREPITLEVDQRLSVVPNLVAARHRAPRRLHRFRPRQRQWAAS